MAKSSKRLNTEIEIALHLDPEDTNGRLVVLNAGGESKGDATSASIQEYVKFGSIGGDRDASIGIRFDDKNDNDVAITLTRAEDKRFLTL